MAAAAGAVARMSGNAAPKAASILASTLSVLPRAPAAFGRSLACRGLMTGTENPLARRDCGSARRMRPVASMTARVARPP